MKSRLAVFGGIGLFLAAIIWYVIFDSLSKEFSEKESEYKSMIGKSVVIKSDTLMIMDYSMINNNYTLSDGRKISFDLANLLVK